MTSLLAAVQFLTVAPPVVRRAFTPAELGRAVGFFPIVGLLLGGLLAGLVMLLEGLLWPLLTPALVLALWVLATGALHVDGFLDTCDGLLGGRAPEERLRIMRDEHKGAFAVAGGVLLLLLKFAALYEVPVPQRGAALIVAPTLARWSMVLAIVGFPYARTEGLGRDMKDHAGWQETALAGASAAAIAVGFALWLGLIALVLTATATWILGRLALTRLPGLTGDIYGALCELVEVLILIVFAAGGGRL